MDDTNQQDNIEEKSENVASEAGFTVTGGDEATQTGQSYEAVKGVIQNLSIKLDELKDKKKEYQQRIKNLLDNDAQLSAYEETAKEAAEAFKKRKQELRDSVEGKEAAAKVKEVGEEIKDIEESLTNHLLNYFQITGTKSFPTPDGEEREFRLKARLLPNPKKK